MQIRSKKFLLRTISDLLVKSYNGTPMKESSGSDPECLGGQ